MSDLIDNTIPLPTDATGDVTVSGVAYRELQTQVVDLQKRLTAANNALQASQRDRDAQRQKQYETDDVLKGLAELIMPHLHDNITERIERYVDEVLSSRFEELSSDLFSTRDFGDAVEEAVSNLSFEVTVR